MCLGVRPPGSRPDTEVCLSGLSGTRAVDCEVVFQLEKKNPLVKESTLQFVSAGQGISGDGFPPYRWAISPEQTIGISMGFTRRAERISFGEFIQGR